MDIFYMDKFYSTKDIQHFLLDHGILWNGIGTFKNHNHKIIAKIKPIKDDKEYEVLMQINEVDFKIYKEDCTICYEESFITELLYRDYSLDWILYLAKLYPEHKSLIEQIILNRKESIHNVTQSEIKPLQKKIDELEDKEKMQIEELELAENILNK